MEILKNKINNKIKNNCFIYYNFVQYLINFNAE